MRLRMIIYIFNEHGEMVDRHTFYSDDEKTLYAISSGFNFAMSKYGENYKVYVTPIVFNTFESDEEDK